MLFRTKAMAGVLLAAALTIGTVVMAAAGATPVSLVASPTRASFGQTVDLQPSVTTTQVVPGDMFGVQILTNGEWADYGEGLQVEDTDTVVPQSIVMDDSIQFPAQFRVVFKPKSSKNATESISEPVTVSVVRNTRVKVVIAAPKKIVRGGSRFGFTVSPDSGVGTVKIRVLDKRGRVVMSATNLTNEYGYASRLLKFPKAGTYRVEAQWLGNQFGKATTWAVKNISVR